MPLHLSERQARRLGLKPPTRPKLPPLQTPLIRHAWHRTGRGYMCQRCHIFLADAVVVRHPELMPEGAT